MVQKSVPGIFDDSLPARIICVTLAYALGLTPMATGAATGGLLLSVAAWCTVHSNDKGGMASCNVNSSIAADAKNTPRKLMKHYESEFPAGIFPYITMPERWGCVTPSLFLRYSPTVNNPSPRPPPTGQMPRCPSTSRRAASTSAPPPQM